MTPLPIRPPDQEYVIFQEGKVREAATTTMSKLECYLT